MCTIVLLLDVLPSTRTAHAATIVVTSTADAVPTVGICPSTVGCSLRRALEVAQHGDTIQFAISGAIMLAAGLELTRDVTLQGPGAAVLALDGRDSVRVLHIRLGVQATISGLTIRNGIDPDGGPGINGGGINNEGTLTVADSVVSNNTAPVGAGINNSGTLNVTNTTFSDNQASSSGGGIASGTMLSVTGSTFKDNSAASSGGGIFNYGTATATNSTFSENAAVRGGGIANSALNAGALTLFHATLSGNSASFLGGNLDNDGGAVHLRSTILVGGSCGGTIATAHNTLSDSGTCVTHGSQGNILTATPLLGPLANNGGPTETHALLSGSPAIDGVTFAPTGCGTTITHDQRGVTRPKVGIAARCDIGAYEREGGAPQIGTIPAQTTDEDTKVGPVSFTISDAETPSSGLILSGTSSNPTLLPNANITFSGTFSERTVTLTPAPNQSGSANVTVTVSDGASTGSTTFVLTVNAVNDPPANIVPPAQSTNEDIPRVFSAANGNAIRVNDVDAGVNPMRMTLTATNGTVTANGTAGLTVVSGTNGSSAVTVSGPLAALNVALDGLRFTPTPHYHGPASLQIASDDRGHTGTGGARTDTDTVAIAVQAVNDPPVAANDSYAVAATQALTVPVAQGVLANDTDVEDATLAAQVVAKPQHGNVTLHGDGSFVYTPAATFSGTDSFTYRASDGAATSNVATVTLTVNASACAPRPRVVPNLAAGGGQLTVRVEATPLNSQQNNPLLHVQFGAFENARVTLAGQQIGPGHLHQPPPATHAATFTVERVTPGQPTLVYLTIRDGCGIWQTFVGGGTSAGF